MNNNTDIEELRYLLVAQSETVETDDGEYLAIDIELSTPIVSEFIQQKVIEARIDELEAVSVSTIRQSAKSGRIGEWITIDERVKMLEAQLNHNKKGDSDE